MFKQYKSFMTKRYFPRSKQIIFILGIIVISVITGFFGSFLTSATQRDYFVSSKEDNVITILQAGYKTPVVSFIPSNYLDVLREIKGIIAISPEVHSLVLIDQTPVTLHGITSSFFELNSSQTIAGKNLSYLVNSNQTEAIIAGYKVANELHLKVGSTYNIFSSSTNAFGSFYVAGIIRFNNFYDEEIFSNIDVANYFRSQSSYIYYSMIRIKIDTSIITKAQINSYLSQRFLLTIHLQSHYQNSALVQQQSVKVLFSNGVLAGENTTNRAGSCSFLLPIGLYDIFVNSGSNTLNQSLLFLSSTTKKIYVDQFGPSTLVGNNYNLSLTALYNNQSISSTNLAITSPYGYTYDYSGNALYQFYNIPSGSYNLKLSHDNITIDKTLELSSNLNLAVNFTQNVQFIVKNYSNDIISAVNCSFYDFRTGQTNTYSSCPASINLAKSVYNVTLTTPTNYSRSFILPVNPTSSSTQVPTFIGFGLQSFEIQDSLNNPLSNIVLYSHESSTNSFVNSGSTNSSGIVNFPFVYGKTYDLLFSNGIVNASMYYSPTSLPSLLIYHPFENFSFSTTFFNGNNFNSTIAGLSVNLLTLDGNSTNYITDPSGTISFNSSYDFAGTISVTYDNSVKTFSIDTAQQKNYSFTLGLLNLNLIIRSTDHQVIPNVTVDISSLNVDTSFTNSNGTLHLQLPSNTVYNSVTENLLTPSEFNINSFSTSFLSDNFFKVSVSFNLTKSTFYVTRTYAYSNYSTVVSLPYFFSVSFNIRDSAGYYVSNAKILLIGSTNTYSILTNSNGQATTQISPGNYFVSVKYIDYEFDYSFSFSQNQTLSLKLPIFINKIVVSYWKPNLSALSGKQYLDQFYKSSLSYFLQIFTILIIIFTLILILLFSSVVKLTIESLEYEIFILNYLGSSKYELFFNLLYNFQIRSLVSSALGLFIGMFMSQFVVGFNQIHILGFIFNSEFNIGYFLLFLASINFIIFVVLVNMLRNMDLIYPIHLIRRT